MPRNTTTAARAVRASQAHFDFHLGDDNATPPRALFVTVSMINDQGAQEAKTYACEDATQTPIAVVRADGTVILTAAQVTVIRNNLLTTLYAGVAADLGL